MNTFLITDVVPSIYEKWDIMKLEMCIFCLKKL